MTLLRARLAALAIAFAVVSCGGGGAGDAPAAPAPPPPPPASSDSPLADPVSYSVAANASLPATTAETEAVTHHSIALASGPIAYTAHTGHLVARDASSGAPLASFFHVSYVADGAPAASRPVTFFYNGGPGSASVWLHLGSFGPKRLVTGDPSTSAPTPFPLVDNAETLLDTSDLVFVDAIGTGYSQAIAPNTNQSFWGVDADAAAFREFVRRWLAANGRTASPVYLFGESYGATRTPLVAHLMLTAGMRLDGIVLQSSALDYNANCELGSATSCAGFFPTYGETGAYYHLASPAPARTDAYAAQLRSFTASTYDAAVSAWITSATPPSADLANTLQSLTGWSAASWTANVNVEPSAFRARLVAGTLVGRYDARVSAPSLSPLAAGGDPSITFISAQFAGAIGNYLRGHLAYTNTSTYVTSSNAIASWNFSHDGRSLVDAVPDLATALALKPGLKVLSLNGYYDVATPFLQTERDLARLGSQSNLAVRFYDGGHMTYLDDAARPRQKQDLRDFYARTPS